MFKSQHFIQTLRSMTPGQRPQKVFDLSAFTKALFPHGLRKRFIDKTDAEIKPISKN